MPHTRARWAMLLLAVCAVLFTADAAITASVSPSVLVEIVLGAVGLAAVMLDLADRALHGTARERRVAVLALNGIGVAPAAVALVFLPRDLDDASLSMATRATIVWLIAVLAWTTTVVRMAVRNERPRRSALAAALRLAPRARFSRGSRRRMRSAV